MRIGSLWNLATAGELVQFLPARRLGLDTPGKIIAGLLDHHSRTMSPSPLTWLRINSVSGSALSFEGKDVVCNEKKNPDNAEYGE